MAEQAVRRSASTPARGADWLTIAAVGATIATAWGALLWAPHGGAGIAGFVAAWTVMMAAMMLPSAVPFILLYRRGSSVAGTAALAAGYLAVWTVVGVAAWGLHLVAMDVPAAAVLAVAGLYQLTPAKRACLDRCRSPADFLAQRWRSQAFVLGVDHGVWCLGCCWALMAVLVVAGMMGLVWVVGIAGVVAAEKLLPRGLGVARLTGIAFLAAAALEALT